MVDKNSSRREIRGYCAQCSCWCPTVAEVQDGVFVKVRPDLEHPLGVPLCPKGMAGPEMVYNQQRLKYPMRRTKPKGEKDPGWERITWDEALDTIATKLNEIKAKFGPESVAVARCGPGGSPMSEIWRWAHRLTNAFGSPNFIATTHICNWHRDAAPGYTFGGPGSMGRAEYERAGCIMMWGNDTPTTRNSFMPLIKRGLKQGAKLIVVDPRRTELAAMASLWLQVSPGTDGALALSMINVMLEEKRYDSEFVRDWTTAPFLVRSDTGNLLKASDVAAGGNPAHFVMVDKSQSPGAYAPGTVATIEPVVDTALGVKLLNGTTVECKTAFRLLRELSAKYAPAVAEKITGVPQDKIKDAVKTLTSAKPACWYAWNGVEQNINASQTSRALCLLYALTGDYDKAGGNCIPPRFALKPIEGYELLTAEQEKSRLGLAERPLGPAGVTSRNVRASDVYQAVLTGKPYPIKALVGFGGNIVTSGGPARIAKEALSRLDFHVQIELFMSPAAELADIVLPAASLWESWHVGVNSHPLGKQSYVELRPAVVPPQHESWPDMKIIFKLAQKLGLGDKFWNGDAVAAFNDHLSPAKITVEQLRDKPGGIAVDTSMEYQKYRKKDPAGNFVGFSNPTKRVVIYSQLFKDHGYDPLPVWTEPSFLSADRTKYPLTLTSGKVIEFCHSQLRALPSLRKRVPHPFLEINPAKAGEIGCQNGDWVILETPYGSIRLQAKLSDKVRQNVVWTQNGWWQACTALNLPGYDPFSPEGANVCLLYSGEEQDPISGSQAIKGYPCNVRKESARK